MDYVTLQNLSLQRVYNISEICVDCNMAYFMSVQQRKSNFIQGCIRARRSVKACAISGTGTANESDANLMVGMATVTTTTCLCGGRTALSTSGRIRFWLEVKWIGIPTGCPPRIKIDLCVIWWLLNSCLLQTKGFRRTTFIPQACMVYHCPHELDRRLRSAAGVRSGPADIAIIPPRESSSLDPRWKRKRTLEWRVPLNLVMFP